MVITKKIGSFTMDGLAGDLNRILCWKTGQAENALALPELQMHVACSALNACINYLEVMTSNV